MAIVRKVIDGVPYLYEQYRVHGKKVSIYIGPEARVYQQNPEIAERRAFSESQGIARKINDRGQSNIMGVVKPQTNGFFSNPVSDARKRRGAWFS